MLYDYVFLNLGIIYLCKDYERLKNISIASFIMLCEVHISLKGIPWISIIPKDNQNAPKILLNLSMIIIIKLLVFLKGYANWYCKISILLSLNILYIISISISTLPIQGCGFYVWLKDYATWFLCHKKRHHNLIHSLNKAVN